MSVNPGFSGQAFMPEVLQKVETIHQRLRPDQRLQMDGGVGLARDLGRQRQRAPGDDDVVGGCRCGARSIRLAFRGLCGRVEALQFGVDRRALAQQFLASRVGAGLSGRRRSGKRGDRRREKR